MRRALLRLILVALMASPASFATKIPDRIKGVVSFVFVPKPDGSRVPNGTGFFVGVKLSVEPARYHVYFVTASHVLLDENGHQFAKIWIRLNLKSGPAELVEVDLQRFKPYRHKDPTVDLAVIPLLPKEEKFEFQFLPDEFLTTREEFSKLGIAEGSDVFFMGLFSGHIGQRKNSPITRFGKVAMVTDDKVFWQEAGKPPQLLDLYLIESFSFGGNSGSPVFFFLGIDREVGGLVLGPPLLKLAGIMKGSFDEGRPIVAVERNAIPVSVQNMGISAVIPSFLLYEILFSDELKEFRSKVK